MLEKIMKCIRHIYNLRKFNKNNDVTIESRQASLKAKYGKKVRVVKNSYIDADTEIGDYSYVNKNSSLENCVIGKFCSISSGVFINPYEHDYNMLTTHPIIRNGVSDNSRKKVIIGNDVLISLNVIITSGVKIGDGAVIGAGAVVTKDVEPYEIVGGVPAKHIKWRFEEKKIKKILKEKWWDWSEEKINKNIEYLKNKTEKIV